MEELKISIAILLVIQAVQFGVCIVLIHKISNLESDRFLLQNQINSQNKFTSAEGRLRKVFRDADKEHR